MKQKYFAFIFLSVLITQSALAGRIGNGRSWGMQRSIPSYSKTNNNYSQNSNYNNSNTNNNQQRRSIGAGTAAALGAAAGAAGGYMLGKSMSQQDNNKQMASGISQQEAATNLNNASSAENKFPWGIISILVILLAIGLMFFRKKANPQFENQNGFNSNNQNNKFSIPSIQNDKSSQQQTINKSLLTSVKGTQDNVNNDNEDLMPDGIEKIYFLRQAKGIFLHIQSMNSTENLDEIAKYFTPDLYNELKEEIAKNDSIADFPVLNCELVNAKVEEENKLLASVSFTGTVSENPTEQAQPFFEIWHFIKPDMKNNNKWLVTGIQQNPSTAANT